MQDWCKAGSSLLAINLPQAWQLTWTWDGPHWKPFLDIAHSLHLPSSSSELSLALRSEPLLLAALPRGALEATGRPLLADWATFFPWINYWISAVSKVKILFLSRSAISYAERFSSGWFFRYCSIMTLKVASRCPVVICFLHWAQFYCFDWTKEVKQPPQKWWLHGCTATGTCIISRQIEQVICSFSVLFIWSFYYWALFLSSSNFLISYSVFFLSWSYCKANSSTFLFKSSLVLLYFAFFSSYYCFF